MIPLAKPIIGEEEINAVVRVLKSGMLAQGPVVKEFEEHFAAYCGTKYAIAVNSGTAALHAALYGLEVRTNDEVITTPFTFVATANSILMANAKPVFVDVDQQTYTIDPKLVESAITLKTKAILPVNLYGQMCDYDTLNAIAKKHHVAIIEDAAQSIGADWHTQRSGSLTAAAAFSLYATKNIMCGEGGVVTTNSEQVAELAKRMRHHGQSEKTRYQYFDLGYNYRMTDIHASIALEQLKKIAEITTKRIMNAQLLTEGLQNIHGIKTPHVTPQTTHVFHQYTILIEEEFPYSRDTFVELMKQKGIGCAVFYPKPLHLHPHFMRLGYKEGDFPIAEKLATHVVSLPVHPLLTIDEIKTIITTIREIANG